MIRRPLRGRLRRPVGIFYLSRIRAGLKDRYDTAAGILSARGKKILGTARVMRKIIDYGHAAHVASNFQAPLNALELSQRFGDGSSIKA